MFDSELTRREFLKKAGTAGVIGAGLASTNFASVIAGAKDFSGVTVDYWDVYNAQSRPMKMFVQEIINAYEKRTGATVKVNWSSFAAQGGPKWRTAFKAGKRPVVFNAGGWEEGPLRKYLRDLKDFYKEETNIYETVRWALKQEDIAFGRVYPDRRIFFPSVYIPRQTLACRMDHLKAAGIDVEKQWPPQDMAQWISLGLQVKEAGVVDYPLWICTAKYDAGDCDIPAWVCAHEEGVENGIFISRDWKECNCYKPVWHQVLSTLVDVYRKLHLTNPQTPNQNDENGHEAIARGDVTMVPVESGGFGTILDRSPELLENGTIQFAHWPDMGSGVKAFETINYYHCIVAQEGPDADVKERAGWELCKEWLRPEHQSRLVPLMSGLPIDQDLWENEDIVPKTKHGYYQALKDIAAGKPSEYAGHSQSAVIHWDMFARRVQRMFRGEITVEEGLAEYVAEVNELLERVPK